MKIEISFSTVVTVCFTLIVLAFLRSCDRDRSIDAQMELNRSILRHSEEQPKGSGTLLRGAVAIRQRPKTGVAPQNAPTGLQCAAMAGIFDDPQASKRLERVVLR